MAIFSRLGSTATVSTLSLKGSPQVVGATRSLVASSIHTGAPPNYPDEETDKWEKEIEKLMWAKHPFMRRGPRSPLFGVYTCCDEAHVRMDMPGVGKEGLKIWPENGCYVVRGFESDNTDDDQEEEEEEETKKRVYSYQLVVDPATVKKDGIKTHIENGVCRIVFHLHPDPTRPI